MPYLYNPTDTPIKGKWKTDRASDEDFYDGPMYKGEKYHVPAKGYATSAPLEGEGTIIDFSDDACRDIMLNHFQFLIKRTYKDAIICPFTGEELPKETAAAVIEQRGKDRERTIALQKAREMEELANLNKNVSEITTELKASIAKPIIKESITVEAPQSEPLSGWNAFVAVKRKEGLSMKEIGALWKIEKEKQ